ncbi:hypothetical protein Tco_0044486 [Tanacetum coccineum]
MSGHGLLYIHALKQYSKTMVMNTMQKQNVPAQPPTKKLFEQIVPRSQWLSIGKSNLLFNAQKIQKNPIFQISVDILSIQLFTAYTASANVPAIYLQQFGKRCHIMRIRLGFIVVKLRSTHGQPSLTNFELPPSGDSVIDFVDELGYPEPVEIVSVYGSDNYVYQPWRAILCLLNQCLTGKILAVTNSDTQFANAVRNVTQTNVDHAELIWEESLITEAIQQSCIIPRSEVWILIKKGREEGAAAPKGDQDQGEVDSSSSVTSGVSFCIRPEKHMSYGGPDPEPMKEDRLDQTRKNYMCLLLDQNAKQMD